MPLCILCSAQRDLLQRAVLQCCYKTENKDPFFENKHALASESFNGSYDSFVVACGNITSSRNLKEYGLCTIDKILHCISELFDDLQLENMCSLIISHHGYVLLEIINKSNIKNKAKVQYLDIAKLIEETKALEFESQQEYKMNEDDVKLDNYNKPTNCNNLQVKTNSKTIAINILIISTFMLLAYLKTKYI